MGKKIAASDKTLAAIWWAIRDSNPGPTGYEPGALPTELMALVSQCDFDIITFNFYKVNTKIEKHIKFICLL